MSEMSASDRQKRLLIILAVAFVAVLGWRVVVPALDSWLNTPSAVERARDRVAKTRTITDRTIERVHLTDLQREGGSYTPDRNIFGYGEKPAPPPPPRPKPPPRVIPPPPPPVVPREPQPPAIDFELLGIFGPENRRIAVLVDEEEIINALVEDVVKEQFIVNSIGYESVEFRFVGFPVDKTQRLEISGDDDGSSGQARRRR